VPTSLGEYDITTLEPALPVLPALSMDTTMSLVDLLPLVSLKGVLSIALLGWRVVQLFD